MPEYHDPLTDPNAPWRREPATEAQKRKLRFYRRQFPNDLTKGEAAELIDDAMARHPEKEEQYQHWKKAEEDLANWYLQAITSDFVGDDMGEAHTRDGAGDDCIFRWHSTKLEKGDSWRKCFLAVSSEAIPSTSGQPSYSSSTNR